MTDKESLQEFLSRAKRHAWSEYHCSFTEPEWGEDQDGVFMKTIVTNEETPEVELAEDLKEAPKIYAVAVNIGWPTPGSSQNVALVEWPGKDRPPSLCTTPVDLFAVLYTQ